MEHGDKYKGLYRSATARAQWHDYNGGAYFITICTHQHRHYFGEILDGKMRLTQVGECAAKYLEMILVLHQDFIIEAAVVMPNHVHAIISTYLPHEIAKGLDGGNNHYSGLSRIVQSYKSAVTKFARSKGIKFGWQPRFYDRIIRNRRELESIIRYIATNIENWELDHECR